MTFSIIARCTRTGAFGAAITTSDLAVGARCVGLVHGCGAVLSQHRTDSRLRDLAVARLRAGDDADAVLTTVCDSSPDIEWRQVAVMDAKGRTAVHHGRLMYSIHAHAVGRSCLALGNILDNPDVPAAMVAGFDAAPDAPLGDRLLRALAAGEAAGGEIAGKLASAALRVTGPHDVDLCDLRVDRAAGDAIAELADLHRAWDGRGEILRGVSLAPDSVPVRRSLLEASVARIRELGLEERFPTDRRRGAWTVAD
jgi:uncharacterized Ntn-hydrolase superfamily protein